MVLVAGMAAALVAMGTMSSCRPRQALPFRVSREDVNWFCNETWIQETLRTRLAEPASLRPLEVPCATNGRQSRRSLPRCPRCECTFVDMGLNNGDSLLRWPLALAGNRSWGGHQAKTSRERMDNKRWEQMRRCLSMPADQVCYYGFEINPGFTRHLLARQARWREEGVRVHVFTETAVGLNDAGVQAHVEPVETFSVESAYATSVISGLNKQAKTKPVSVRSVDAAELIASLAAKTGFLAVKVRHAGRFGQPRLHQRPQDLR